MNLEEIKKIKWQYLVNRREVLLFTSITSNSYKYFEKITGIPWKVNYEIRFADGDIFYDKKDLDKLRSLFIKRGDKVFFDFRKHLLIYVNKLDKIASEVERTDCSKLTKNQLIKLLDKYIKAALYAGNFLSPMGTTDRMLSKKILSSLPDASKEQKREWLGILTYPLRENEHIKEEKSFYNLVSNYKKKSFNSLLEKHLREFGWIGARGYSFNQNWKRKDIEKRIDSFISQNKNVNEEIKNLENIKKERLKSFKELIKKLKIKKTSSLYDLILITKDYAYLRTWRTDIIYGVGYKAKNLFYEIAKRAKLKENDIVHFTFQEVIEMAKKGKSPLSSKELEKRKKIFASIFIKDEYKIISDRKLEEKIENIVKGKKQTKIREIKGSIAFRGKVKARVKIVLTTKDINKVKQGDVLVAVMTFPNYISAMERASAFVTNEGGILCHAAIISREMNKPCIIGTKIATKVLKDGDLVEVDADNGIVKIIKKG